MKKRYINTKTFSATKNWKVFLLIDSQKVVINMGKETIIQVFRLKNIKEIKNYFIKEIDQNDFMSNNHGKVFATLNYIEHLLILSSVVTG